MSPAVRTLAGLYVALKVTSYTIDTAAAVDLAGLERLKAPALVAFPPEEEAGVPQGGLNIRSPDDWNAQEERMYSHKLRAVRSFVRANRLNRVVYGAGAPDPAAAALPVPLSSLHSSEKGSKGVLTRRRPAAGADSAPAAAGCGRAGGGGVEGGAAGRGGRLGVVTCGTSAADVAQQLALLGLSSAGAARAGVSVLKVAVAWPLEPLDLTDWVAAQAQPRPRPAARDGEACDMQRAEAARGVGVGRAWRGCWWSRRSAPSWSRRWV